MSDFYGSWEQRAARKSHRCCTCFRVIDPGESYRTQRNHYDGRWYTFAMCEHCTAIWNLYRPEDWDTGGMSEDSWDTWMQEGSPWKATDPDETVWRELRHRVQCRRRWRNLAGDLYPIPVALPVAVGGIS